jgi:hypothetical protein
MIARIQNPPYKIFKSEIRVYGYYPMVARANEAYDMGRNRICDAVRQKSFSATCSTGGEKNKPLKNIYVRILDRYLRDNNLAYSMERNDSGGLLLGFILTRRRIPLILNSVLVKPPKLKISVNFFP